jgi:hypothetical protein
MSRPALEVADIFRDRGPAWRKAHAGHVSLNLRVSRDREQGFQRIVSNDFRGS